MNAAISLMGQYPELTNDRNQTIRIRENVKKIIAEKEKEQNKNKIDTHKEWTERMKENVAKLNASEAEAALGKIDELIADLE